MNSLNMTDITVISHLKTPFLNLYALRNPKQMLESFAAT